MGKIVGVKILANVAWILVWMTEEQAKQLIAQVDACLKTRRGNVVGTMQGTCAMTGITWVVARDSVHAIHTITDEETQLAQQQIIQQKAQTPRPLVPSPFRASGRG